MKNHWLKEALELWSNDSDYVIASSQEDAKQIAMKLCGYGRDEVDDWDWFILPKNFDFKFADEDMNIETKTVGEWIKIYGRGYFASSEY